MTYWTDAHEAARVRFARRAARVSTWDRRATRVFLAVTAYSVLRGDHLPAAAWFFIGGIVTPMFDAALARVGQWWGMRTLRRVDAAAEHLGVLCENCFSDDGDFRNNNEWQCRGCGHRQLVDLDEDADA